MITSKRLLLAAACLAFVARPGVGAEPAFEVHENQVYGMYSGTALLGDLYVPKEPNGLALVHVSGSGWHAPSGYGARPLKQSPHVKIWVEPLSRSGFTVLTINHRAAPTFKYPAQIEDVERAVRYLRSRAEELQIDPDRLGAIGGSSGGHLVTLLGVRQSFASPDAKDPVDRLSAAVQCVVARAPVTDLTELDSSTVTSLMGLPMSYAQELYIEASPVRNVTPDDPPLLLIHGDNDSTVPFAHSENLKAAYEKAGIAVELIRVEGAGHGPTFPGAARETLSELVKTATAWFERCLGGSE